MMKQEEYAIMAEMEESHWWYLGLRHFLKSLLERYRSHLGPQPRILDAGCGTGANLQFLNQQLQPSLLTGFDFSSEAVSTAQQKNPNLEIYTSDIRDPILNEEELDLIISMDVIYIPGSQKSLPGLKKLVAALKPGGLFIANLPAYQWLYSEHDVAISTTERYTKKSATKLMIDLDLSVELLTYRVFFLFPLIVAARLPYIFGKKVSLSQARSDLEMPPAWLNELFYQTLKTENQAIKSGFSLPCGSSVAVVGMKR